MADFYTHFRFVIDSSNSNYHANGLAFFLAPVDSTIPGNSSGSGLGLAYFDAMANISGDPLLQSSLILTRMTGILMVQIVIFTGYMSNQKQKSRLDYKLDLRNYLPELVSFGFSAATGKCFEKNNVKSSEFNSSLEIVSNSSGPADPPTVTNINTNPGSAVNNEGKKDEDGISHWINCWSICFDPQFGSHRI
ncbi:L-type lectin-domain containing receptor kinase -like [Olea europaea subsp. europaea]|uniref:L-type lectin-domain containing receptor kinase -like n=1 Tax=Olea europaea subsp. europaea TaxID=158383 RepID=A0A8S0U8U9_OLEEU|nr:L-type lectin-domain containing receptor kinase -like [Olea europaea subsp. europaea]